MIHTIEYATIMIDDIELIKDNFKITKEEKQLVYYRKYRALDFKYYQVYNVLHIKINLNRLLDKDVIVEGDYSKVLKEYKKQFYEFGFYWTNPTYQLNRVDYKSDIITENKDIYIKLLKKASNNYRALKQYSKYKSSVYYNSKSMNINVYDKEQELIDTDSELLVDINKYKNMLRFEVQLKRNKLYYLEKTWGQTRELVNYFHQKDHDYWINYALKKIIYCGDYYNLYHSKKILQEHYSKSMVGKLTELQKDISINGISEAKKNYTSATFNNHIKKLESVVNPILIPKGEGITHLKNIFNFTDENIYLLNEYCLRAS